MADRITIPQWYDLHVHLRQGPAMAAYIKAHIDMGCAGILAMPNTRPPVSKIFDADDGDGWSVEFYLEEIRRNGGEAFTDIIVPLYLTGDTTPTMIEKGAKSGLLRACKYYPPHGTTNADHGRPLQHYVDNSVIEAIRDNNVVLCLHGEEHGLKGEDYFGKDSNAEDYFYRERMTRLRDSFPDLRIVCEHITTKTAADFVKETGDKCGATITPQHLLYTVGDLVQGLRYHLYCLPLVKFEQDRQALLNAVLDPSNTQFFAGTDSAPHTTKCTPCGCAAGCFTGGIAPQLYIRAFENGARIKEFERFLCHNGPAFYKLPVPEKTLSLVRATSTVTSLKTAEGEVMPLPLGLGQDTLEWSLEQ